MSPSPARNCAICGSFASSIGEKRVFSTKITASVGVASIAARLGVSMKITSCPSAASRAGVSCARLISGTGRPFGRPKWAKRTTRPPFARMSRIVGMIFSIRVASVTRPFSIGTLMSTRVSTVLPARSRSSKVFHAICGLRYLGNTVILALDFSSAKVNFLAKKKARCSAPFCL